VAAGGGRQRVGGERNTTVRRGDAQEVVGVERGGREAHRNSRDADLEAASRMGARCWQTKRDGLRTAALLVSGTAVLQRRRGGGGREGQRIAPARGLAGAVRGRESVISQNIKKKI